MLPHAIANGPEITIDQATPTILAEMGNFEMPPQLERTIEQAFLMDDYNAFSHYDGWTSNSEDVLWMAKY